MEKKHGYHTSSRVKIMDYLKGHKDQAVSASDIATHLMENDAAVNITTIYRYLDRLTKEGTVNKFVQEGGSRAIYQYVDQSHQCESHLHLKCVNCGSVIHLECEFMDEISEHIKKDHGFELICKQSVLYGLCVSCIEAQGKM